MDNQSFICSMLSGLLNLHRDAEHGDGDKQEHAEECVDAFHAAILFLLQRLVTANTPLVL